MCNISNHTSSNHWL